MKTRIHLLSCLIFVAAWTCLNGQGQQMAPGLSLSSTMTDMTSIPDGNYLLTLEAAGMERRLNIKVTAHRAHVVKNNDPTFDGLEGQFRLIQNGVFLVVLRKDGATVRSQVWIFRSDGSAAIREIPDRGELQRAVPVANDSIVPPEIGQREAIRIAQDAIKNERKNADIATPKTMKAGSIWIVTFPIMRNGKRTGEMYSVYIHARTKTVEALVEPPN